MFPNRWVVRQGAAGAPVRRCGRLALTRLLVRFRRRQEGAAAVEFAFVLLPFLGILLMTMETAAYFFAQQTLETAVADSGRLIMTGQAQNFSADQFKSAVCSKIYGLFDCTNGMYVDVRDYSSGSTISTSVQYDSQGKPVTQYQPGASGNQSSDIVVVRLIYKWPIITPLIQTYLADTPSSSTRTLVATAAFRNEPY